MLGARNLGNRKALTALHRATIFVVLLLALGAGCSHNEHPELRKVSGRVTYNDAPVAEATIAFHSPQSTRLATGRTDEQGHYQLTTYEANDGAQPGEYTVIVTKVEDEDEEVSLSMDEAVDAKPTRRRVRQLLPEKYATQESSPLRVTVPEDGSSSLDIQLRDD